MLRYLVVLVIFGLSVEATPMWEKLVKKSDNERVPGQYIVVLKPGFKAVDFATNFEATKSKSFVNCSIINVYKEVINGFSARLTMQGLQKFLELEEVEFVEENGVVKAYQAPGSWGLDRVDQRYLPLDDQAEFTGDGSGVTAYILDTGIYPSNTYFGGRAAVGYDAIGDGLEGIDCNGHGTHAAGTIGADYYGVARGASLLGVRVLNCFGSGVTNNILAGLDWVLNNAKHPAVASMSLGGGASDVLDYSVATLISRGVLVSVAAGNDDGNACNYSPARLPEAFTVGATDIDDYRADFSNYGTCLDIFAPGVDITSTWYSFSSAFETLSGTSMSCPHVAGATAIALGNNNSLTPAQVKQQIVDDASKDVVHDNGMGSPNLLLYIPCCGADRCSKVGGMTIWTFMILIWYTCI